MTDSIDNKLLYMLLKDAKAPISKISKTPGLTREIVSYRMQKLFDVGVIKQFTVKIYQPYFASGAAHIMLKLRDLQKIDEIIKKLQLHENVNWIAKLSGTFDIAFSVLYLSVEDLSRTVNDIQNEFGKNIQEHVINLYIEELKFNRAGLVYQGADLSKIKKTTKLPKFKEFSKNMQLSKEDKILLNLLSVNCRAKNADLAKKTGLGEEVVRLHIKKLEKEGIIQGYTANIDTNKLGFEGYLLGLQFESFDITTKNKIKAYVESNPYVTFCAHTSGTYNIMLTLQTKNRKQFTEILEELRVVFSKELRRYEFQLQIDEYKEIYLPTGLLK